MFRDRQHADDASLQALDGGRPGFAERTVKALRAQGMAQLGATDASELGRTAAQLHGRGG